MLGDEEGLITTFCGEKKEKSQRVSEDIGVILFAGESVFIHAVVVTLLFFVTILIVFAFVSCDWAVE